MAIIPQYQRQTGVPGPAGTVRSGGPSVATGLALAGRAIGETTRIVRDYIEHQQDLKDAAELARAERGVRTTMDKAAIDAQTLYDDDEVKAAYLTAIDNAETEFRPEGKDQAAEFDIRMETLRYNYGKVFRNQLDDRQTERNIKSLMWSANRALEENDFATYKETTRSLEKAGYFVPLQVDALLKRFPDDAAIAQAQKQAHTDPEGARKIADALLEKNKNAEEGDDLTESQLRAVTKIKNFANVADADAERALATKREEVERQAFDLWRKDQLPTQQLDSWRDSGLMSEGLYQTYIRAKARTDKNVNFDYAYWENVVGQIDLVRAGDRSSELISDIRMKIMAGTNRAFDKTVAMSLRKSLTTAMDPGSLRNEPGVQRYYDALKSLKTKNALTNTNAKGEQVTGIDLDRANQRRWLIAANLMDQFVAKERTPIEIQHYYDDLMKETKDGIMAKMIHAFWNPIDTFSALLEWSLNDAGATVPPFPGQRPSEGYWEYMQNDASTIPPFPWKRPSELDKARQQGASLTSPGMMKRKKQTIEEFDAATR